MTPIYVNLSELEFTALREATQACERWVKDESGAVERGMAEALQAYGEDGERAFSEMRERRCAHRHVAMLLRRSLFVSIYAEAEFRLDAYCRHAARDRGFAVSLRDIKGSGVPRAGVYLRKVAGVSLDSIPQWADLMAYNTIRNVCAHNAGLVKDDKRKEIEAYVSTHPSLALGGSRIYMGKAFCREAVDVVQCFFEQLRSCLPLKPTKLHLPDDRCSMRRHQEG